MFRTITNWTDLKNTLKSLFVVNHIPIFRVIFFKTENQSRYNPLREQDQAIGANNQFCQ